MTHGMSAAPKSSGYRCVDIYPAVLERELSNARRWAAVWKRAAKATRAFHADQGEFIMDLADTRDGFHALADLRLAERDSARRVARALYDVMMATAAFAMRDFGDVHAKMETARRVMAEEARHERGA